MRGSRSSGLLVGWVLVRRPLEVIRGCTSAPLTGRWRRGCLFSLIMKPPGPIPHTLRPADIERLERVRLLADISGIRRALAVVHKGLAELGAQWIDIGR